MPVYHTSFEIDAPAARVWEVLTDFRSYPEWNPQIPWASGTIEEGARIDLRLALPGRPAMQLSAIIEHARPGELLTWRGHLGAPWFFEGYRRFEIQPITADRVRVTHVEEDRGHAGPPWFRGRAVLRWG
jgi:hypothetical protein